MALHDIGDWLCDDVRTVELTNGFGDVTYSLKLRMFRPYQGDRLYEMWSEDGVFKKHDIPPFAIERMEEAAVTLREYVDRSIVPAMCKVIGETRDNLIWETYYMAFRYSREAPVCYCLPTSS